LTKLGLYKIFFLAFTVVLFIGCASKKLNQRFTLWRNDKIPYGTYYSFENLDHVFPSANIEINKEAPDKALIGSYYDDEFNGEEAEEGEQNDSAEVQYRSLYLVITPSMEPDEKELRSLMNYISAGNHVFISSLKIGKNVLDSLRVEAAGYSGLYDFSDSLTISIEDEEERKEFHYPGRGLDNYLTDFDSSITTILGYNEEDEPNFVKFTYEGGGSIYLHFAPAAFTNFFLLHGENSRYYDIALSDLPEDIGTVMWDDYYRYHSNGKTKGAGGSNAFSKLGVFLKDDILRWPVWLVLILFAIIYLFESKRKQRTIPVVRPLVNTSLDFVKTIGRLYYQRRDNKDLSYKMTAHFLDHVRTKFNITTSKLDENFEQRLAWKSGYDLKAIQDIVYQMKYLRDQPIVDDDELLEFQGRLDQFYKHV
jgi:hypothetical protein